MPVVAQHDLGTCANFVLTVIQSEHEFVFEGVQGLWKDGASQSVCISDLEKVLIRYEY
jgi:hypothetical protein